MTRELDMAMDHSGRKKFTSPAIGEYCQAANYLVEEIFHFTRQEKQYSVRSRAPLFEMGETVIFEEKREHVADGLADKELNEDLYRANQSTTGGGKFVQASMVWGA